jgi:leucine dehydrogenase
MSQNKTECKVEKIGSKKVVFFKNKSANLRGYIVMNRIGHKPATGGIRMLPYPTKRKALEDGLRLAEAMTYKLALAHLPWNGGKAIIIGDPKRNKTKSLLSAFGEFVESLRGEMFVGEDFGIGPADLQVVATKTKYCSNSKTSSALSTAWGVMGGIEACLKNVFGDTSLKNRTVAIQGAGKVGYTLAELLHKKGAKLILADIDKKVAHKAAKDFNARLVDTNKIYSVNCDVFAPCALGGIINGKTIKQLKCRIVAGAANNQLQKEEDGRRLFEKCILYAPDYIINAGGVMIYFQRSKEWVKKEIYNRLSDLFEMAGKNSEPTNIVSDRLARKLVQINTLR